MMDLNANNMLNVWEQGLNQTPLRRAILLLAVALPQVSTETLTKLSIGQRDAWLLRLRARLFGSTLVNTAICPACSQRIEWHNEIADILLPFNENYSDELEKPFDLKIDDYQIQFRLPNSADIAVAIGNDTNENAQQTLLTHCVMSIKKSDHDHAIDELPDHIIDAIAERIEMLDPQADISMNLSCPECSHQWGVLFDIASFIWTELTEWAERTLHTVHRLARGYGWSERDILRLSPVRRQLYLGVLG